MSIFRHAPALLSLVLIPVASADAADPEYVYAGEGMKLVCFDETATDTGHSINGEIILDGAAFPFTATVDRDTDAATGTFTANGSDYRFTATPKEGDRMALVFKTGNTTKTITYVEPASKAVDNPFNQKTPNPFEQGGAGTEEAVEESIDGSGGASGGGTSTRSWVGEVGDADYRKLEKAAQAYEDGDREAAYAVYKPLAEKGHVGAAYMMALRMSSATP